MMKMCLSSCLLLLFITCMCNASIIKAATAHNATSAVLSPSGGNHPGSGGSGGGGGSSIATGAAKPPASGSAANPPQHPAGPPSSGSGGNGPSKPIVSYPILSNGTNRNGTMPGGPMLSSVMGHGNMSGGPMLSSVMGHGPGPQCVPTVLFGLGSIFFNPNLTGTERNQQMDAWAAKQNASVQAIYTQFKANQTECIAEFNAALIQATVNLNASVQAVVAQLQAIFNNNSLTRMQMMQAVIPIFMNQTPAMKMALFKLKSSIHLNNTNCCMPPPGMEGMGGNGGPGMGGIMNGGMYHSAEQDDNGGDNNGNGQGGNGNGNGLWHNGNGNGGNGDNGNNGNGNGNN